MKVFLGWSGETSHKVATALHGWLPKVIQSVRPYISSEDIAKGARWSGEIAEQLESTNYGIICVTRENLTSPWIHFEAGALSREIKKARVTPFLFNLKQSDIQGPFQQFQWVVNEKGDVLKMLKSINDMQEDQKLTVNTLEEAFTMWWHKLDEMFVQIAKDEANTPAPQKRSDREILEALSVITQAVLRSQDLTRESLISLLTQVSQRLETLTDRTAALGFQIPSLMNLSALSGSDYPAFYGGQPVQNNLARLAGLQKKEEENSGDSQIKTSPTAKGKTK
jgi:hypothetical protein